MWMVIWGQIGGETIIWHTYVGGSTQDSYKSLMTLKSVSSTLIRFSFLLFSFLFFSSRVSETLPKVLVRVAGEGRQPGRRWATQGYSYSYLILQVP